MENQVTKREIITLEEHYLDREVACRLAIQSSSPLIQKLEDFDDIRLQEMDEVGIDLQVLSHAPPGLQGVEASIAAEVAMRVNDRLAAVVRRNPKRLAAFASLPTTDPNAAWRELDRCIEKLGYKGAIIHGMTGDLFIDDRRFWPIFEVAEKLDVPLYIHPADPHPAVIKTYFGDFAHSHPMFVRAAWGFTIETGTQAMRLVLSGALEKYPAMKIILGHFGEAIPFLLPRIDEALSRDTPMKNFRDFFTRQFYVTTSGFFSDPALLCCIQELGVDRIMFSVDWPYVSNRAGVDWIESVALNEPDKRKICSENAKRLLRLGG